MQPAMKEFEVKITRQQSEVEEAQRLRFEVFNLEMKKGLESSYGLGLDADEYDSLCDHLIVRDRSTRRVVGTYRLLLDLRAGFQVFLDATRFIRAIASQATLG